MNNFNEINTPGETADALRLPYKQEVGGSSPSAPTTSQQLTPPSVQHDPLPGEGSGSLSETLTKHCRCGKVSDGWPDEAAEGFECQDCWAQCSEAWWAAHNAYASQAPPRYRGIVFTGTITSSPHGTETQTAHQQCMFSDVAAADAWLVERVNATSKEGVLLVQREEALRVYRPKGSK